MELKTVTVELGKNVTISDLEKALKGLDVKIQGNEKVKKVYSFASKKRKR